MFYLPTEPTDIESFTASLTAGLREVLDVPANHELVDARGNYPALDQLAIDLTGCRVDPARRPPRPRPAGTPSPGVTVAALTILARPLTIEAGKANLELRAQGVRLDIDTDTATGKRLLVPVAADHGSASAEVSRADLEALLLSQARPVAAQQGANLTDLKLTLTKLGDRSLAAEIRATAKKFMMNGVVTIFAKVDVNDELRARLYDLDVKGEGVAGNIAAGFLKPKLKEHEGQQFPLATPALNGLRLRDVRIASTDPVRLEATFGA